MRKVKDEKSIKIKEIFERLKLKIESEYSAQNVTVYMLDGYEVNCIVGEKIDNTVIERYMSYSNTMLLRSPVGLQEDKAFKSRVVTQIKIKEKIYLIVISSYKLEAFKQDISFMIEDIVNAGKEGEIL
ncbi:MAG: hypothetical protein E7505_04330 [Ruminococcus sp.]|nr:hypothetical protein [Ruminococcus sp.]